MDLLLIIGLYTKMASDGQTALNHSHNVIEIFVYLDIEYASGKGHTLEAMQIGLSPDTLEIASSKQMTHSSIYAIIL